MFKFKATPQTLLGHVRDEEDEDEEEYEHEEDEDIKRS